MTEDEVFGQTGCFESPQAVKTSLAGAITLGLKGGSFYRNARLTCLNLLLTYQEGCLGRCSYCGLEKGRSAETKGTTFIRVPWPTYPLEAIIKGAKDKEGSLERICLSMVTNKRALSDALEIIAHLRRELFLPISILVAPTLIRHAAELEKLKEAGADQLGVAVDAATAELFRQHRGRDVKGPHTWEHYWSVLRSGIEVFGTGHVSVHLIVGLGETEQEMVNTLQKVHDLGAVGHLFSFYPEQGSALAGQTPPPLDQYRRIQLARYLIMNNFGRTESMRFNEAGQLYYFGMDIEPFIASGEPFRTSGCPGKNGHTACNRPYGNERPGKVLANYPFKPEHEDIAQIRDEIFAGLDLLN